jgi:hypothetical protein
MTAQFHLSSQSHSVMQHRPVRRLRGDGWLVALCWTTAAVGLTGSYALEGLTLQAASCLLGLIAAAAALLLMVGAERS